MALRVGCSPEQSLCASPLALTSDGKPPAGSHLTQEGIPGLFRVKTVFREGRGCASVLGSASAGPLLVILGTYRLASPLLPTSHPS